MTITIKGFSDLVSEYDIGNRFYVMGDYKSAYEHYFRMTETKDKSFVEKAMYMTGKCQEMLGNIEKAKKIYFDYIRKFPESDKNPGILFTIALSKIESDKKGYSIDALNLLDRIIQNYPDFNGIHKVYEYKILSMIKQGYFQEALNLLQNLLDKKDGTNFDRYCFYLAEIYSNSEYTGYDFKKSIEFYKKIINEHPKSELAGKSYYSMGQAYNLLNDWQNAIHCYRKVIQHYPEELLGTLAKTMIQICYIKRNEFLYGTKSRDTINMLFNSRNKPVKSLEEGLIKDIEDQSRIRLNIYADDSYKNLDRAIYSGNVNVEKGDLKISANKVDCDLKNKILFIKGNVRLDNQKGLIMKSDSVKYDVPKNRIVSTDKFKIMTVQDGEVVEKIGSEVVLELDSGKILIDKVEYKMNQTGF